MEPKPPATEPEAPKAAATDAAAPGDEAEEEELPAEAEDWKGSTGEEDETVIFRADVKLFKLVRDTQVPPVAAVSGSPGSSLGTEAVVKSEETPASADAAPPTTAAAATDSSGAAASPNANGDSSSWRWVERGCGKFSINRHNTTGAGRMVLRMKGILKILLNTPVFPTTKYERVGQKSVMFLAIDAEGTTNASFCKHRLNLGSNDQQSRFLDIVAKFLA